jgi:hypothetical protein
MMRRRKSLARRRDASTTGLSSTPLPPGHRQRPPLFVLLFFALFGCIGIAVLIGLWSPSRTGMQPPWIAKAVGSLIALMFIAMGFGMPISALRASRANTNANADSDESHGERPDGDAESPGAVGYRCPNCGANLGPDQEVSPSGDTKCVYCKRWWNIHQPTA